MFNFFSNFQLKKEEGKTMQIKAIVFVIGPWF
jgi:hypothetical protein